MNTTHLSRLASVVHEALLAGRRLSHVLELPGIAWQRCQTRLRQSWRAKQHGWTLAAERLQHELQSTLSSLGAQITELQQRVDGQRSRNTAAVRYRDVFRDLLALREEFAAVNYDRSSHQLRVRTEEIELEDIELGPFEIRLDLDRLHDDPVYRVVALAPNPPVSRQEVTHPHVMDGIVCEGEGRAAIRRTLADGRLWDFFQLIASVLRTYNEESPYIELVDWYNEPCHDCGVLTHPDNTVTCCGCETSLCYECDTACRGCGEGFCSGCLSACPRCEEPFCRNCLNITCSDCLQQVCNECPITEERCSECHDSEEDSTEIETEPDTTVLAHRLGQTVVPA